MGERILLKLTSCDTEGVAEKVATFVTTNQQGYCIPINVTKYSMAVKDPKLRRSIERASFLVPDGLPITWLAKRVTKRSVKRVTGVDLAQECLRLAHEKNWSVFLLGASEESVSKAAASLTTRYPGVSHIGYRNGFYEDSDLTTIVDQLNEFNPDLLLLGMGLPQKEYFVHDYISRLNCRFCITVGGAFDIWSGSKARAPRLVQKLGMEWAFRSCSNLGKTIELVRHGSTFAADLFFGRRPDIQLL